MQSNHELVLPQARFGAYLFDCDGTLVDSMPLHFEAWNAGFRAAGASFRLEEEDFYGWAGIQEATIVAMLNERHGSTVDPETVITAKHAAFECGIPGLGPVAPVADFARSVVGKGKLGVVSGSPRRHVLACLDAAGLGGLFESLVTPEDVAPGRGKPHPDMFLLQAQQFGVEPAACLVFEDGQSGIDAARAAGMESVFVPRGCS